MRKICGSPNTRSSAPFSSRAVFRSWPNGFSTMMRVQHSESTSHTSPARPSPSAVGAMTDGGSAR
jgi:hypothetical protein